MSDRYNSIDIIVGIGMCAIIFGVLLLLVAVNGTYQMALPQALPSEQSLGNGSTWLQPALGQAIVDQDLFKRRTDQRMEQSASAWNWAMLARHRFESRPGGPLGDVMSLATTGPIAHWARVQEVMGRAIVNSTAHRIRHGTLSADYNAAMVRATALRGQRLHDEFLSTWQSTLGRGIVSATQDDLMQSASIQERLGRAVVQLTLAQTGLEAARAEQQEQLASLVFAAVRDEMSTNGARRPAELQPSRGSSIVASVGPTEPKSWPEISMRYLMLAGLVLAVVFFSGLSLAVRFREKKALAEMRHDASRWVFRWAT
jgi:hypothetical protein